LRLSKKVRHLERSRNIPAFGTPTCDLRTSTQPRSSHKLSSKELVCFSKFWAQSPSFSFSFDSSVLPRGHSSVLFTGGSITISPASPISRRRVCVSTLSEDIQSVTCFSCQFRYPRVRGFCPLCGNLTSPQERFQNSAESLPQKRKALISFVLIMMVLILVFFIVIYRKTRASISGGPAGTVVPTVASSTEPTATASQPSSQSTSSVTDAVTEPPAEDIHAMANDPAELWRRVQRGNANAEVELARLYVAGKGVVQNCEQAHLLLLAASRKRSSAASDVLSGDYAQHCR
jgi:hypothetical protein